MPSLMDSRMPKGQPSRISPQRSERGSEIISTGMEQGLGRALTLDDPKATDKLLEACLPPSVKTSAREIWVDKGTMETGWDGELMTIEMTEPVPQQDRLKALQIVDKSLTPITSAECQKALAKLRLMTKVRAESTEDIRLTLTFYAEELRRYPGDVVRKVLSTQANMSPWWPAWSELKDRLDLYTRKRKKLHEALTAIRPTSPKNSSAAPASRNVTMAG